MPGVDADETPAIATVRAADTRAARAGRWLSPAAWARAAAAVYAVPSGEPWRWMCPGCGHRLLGWRGPAVTVSGRCARCAGRVGAGPWAVEAASAGAVLLMALGPRSAAELLVYLWFAVLGVVLAVVDARVRRLPNALTAAWAGGTLAALALPALREDRGDDWMRAVLAALVLMVLFGLPALLRPGALGWGDVKAAAAVGIALGWLGWAAVYAGVLLAFLLASGAAVVLLIRRRAGRRHQVPLGPFLVVGAVVVVALLPGSG